MGEKGCRIPRRVCSTVRCWRWVIPPGSRYGTWQSPKPNEPVTFHRVFTDRQLVIHTGSPYCMICIYIDGLNVKIDAGAAAWTQSDKVTYWINLARFGSPELSRAWAVLKMFVSDAAMMTFRWPPSRLGSRMMISEQLLSRDTITIKSRDGLLGEFAEMVPFTEIWVGWQPLGAEHDNY